MRVLGTEDCTGAFPVHTYTRIKVRSCTCCTASHSPSPGRPGETRQTIQDTLLTGHVAKAHGVSGKLTGKLKVPFAGS